MPRSRKYGTVAARKEAHRLSSLQHYHRYSLLIPHLAVLIHFYYSNKDHINTKRRIPQKESETETGHSGYVSGAADAGMMNLVYSGQDYIEAPSNDEYWNGRVSDTHIVRISSRNSISILPIFTFY